MPSWTSIKSRRHGLLFPPLANGARMSTGLNRICILVEAMGCQIVFFLKGYLPEYGLLLGR